MKKPFVLAVLAYLLPTFPLGYFWHLVTFADHYKRLALLREDVIIPFGLITMIIQAIAFAGAYPRLFGRHGRHWLRGGRWVSACCSACLPGRSPCCRWQRSTACRR